MHEEVYVLDSLWMNHGSTLGDTLIVKTVEYGVLKTLWHCIKIVCIYQILVFGMQYLENEIVRQLFFEETVAAESYENHVTQFIALLEENEWDCWFQHSGATASTANTAVACMQDSFGDSTGRHDLWPP